MNIEVPSTFRLMRIFAGKSGLLEDFEIYANSGSADFTKELNLFSISEVKEAYELVKLIDPSKINLETMHKREVISNFLVKAFHSGLVHISDLREALDVSIDEFLGVMDIIEEVRERVPRMDIDYLDGKREDVHCSFRVDRGRRTAVECCTPKIR